MAKIDEVINRALDELKRRVENPRPALKAVGAIMLAQSQKAFRDQRLGDVRWPKQYPDQSPAGFLHIAGALSDLNEGGEPKSSRFQRGPALLDTGGLLKDLSERAISYGGEDVGITAAREDAPKHNYGGVSRQPVTATAKAGYLKIVVRMDKQIAAQRKRVSKAARGKAFKRPGAGSAGKLVLMENKLSAIRKLGFVLYETTKTTRVSRRPFLGMDDQAQKDAHDVIVSYFETGKVAI